MIACPNKRLKVWKDLVNVVGENKAHLLWAEYEGNVPDSFYQSEPIIQYSKSPLEDELKAVLEYFKMTKRDRLHQPQLAKGLKTRVEAVNKRLGYEGLVYQEYYKGNKLYMRVGIKSDQPSVELKKHVALSYSNWFNSLTPEQQRSENALREQDGLPPLRVEKSAVAKKAREPRPETDRKIEVLQKLFDVEVEYDETLDAAGAVVPGVKPKIKINPNRLGSDTVIHEFAHIFIDALGGLKNTRVAAAVKQLQGTELWNEIAVMYPELKGEDLAKEVLATAMGMKGAEIFEEASKQSWWDRFIRWFNERIASLLKKDVDYVEQITYQLFNSNNRTLELVSSHMTQFQKSMSEAFKMQKELDKEKHSIAELNKVATNKLKTKFEIITKSPSPSEGYEGYEEKLQTVIKDIEVLTKTSPLLGLHKFVEYASTQLTAVSNTVEKLTNEDSINELLVHKIDLFTGIFEDIDDYIKVVKDNKKDLADLGIETRALEQTLAYLASGKDAAKRNLIDARRRVSAALLAEHSNWAQGLARQRYQVEANKLNLKGKAKEQYIHEKLIENADSFFKENVEFYYNYMHTSITDIDGFEAWVLDAANISSHTVQIVHSYINNANTNIRQRTMDDKAEIAAATEKFLGKRAYVPSNVFANLYEVGSNGMYYLVSKYSPEFNIELAKLRSALKDAIDKNGEKSTEADIAAEAVNNFLKENTTYAGNKSVDGNIVPNIVPKDKYLSDKYKKLNKEELEYLAFLEGQFSKQDKRVPKHKRLMKEAGSGVNASLYQLPGLEAKTSELLIEKGIFSFIKDSARKLVKKSEDETDYGALQEVAEDDNGIKQVFTYESGEEKKEIPIFYRTQPKNQSVDIPTLLVMNGFTTNNYAEKFKLLPKIDIIVRASGEKQFGKSEGFGLKKLLISSSTDEQITFPGIESNEFKVLKSIVEDNIFGVHTIDLHSTVLGADVTTILKNLGKWTSDSMLILNYLSAGANVIQGKTMNAIERFSNGTLNKDNVLRGDSLFWADSSGWLSDVGKPSPSSKTSLLMELFNIKGDYSAISTHFFKNSKAASLASWDRAHFLNGVGEFYTAGTLMYSLLSDIKVMNNKHKFLDKDGNIVETKEEAASILDAYQVRDGKLIFGNGHQAGQHAIAYTTLDYENMYNPGNLSNYIKKIYSDLHGQYDPAFQSMAQRSAIAKLAFMLRKWMLPGMIRRWRGVSTATKKDINPQDKFYSQALMREMEGNYVTAIRFITNMKRSMKDLKFDLAYRMNWNELNDYEKANIRRTILEMSIITGSLAASMILRGLAKGVDDDDEATKTALMLSTFWTRRLYSEMSFYIWPPEQIRILRSPAASISMLESSFRLMSQVQRDIIHFEEDGLHAFEFERYERGPRKGQAKVIKKVEQVLPIFKNVNRNVEDATDYLWNTF